MLSLKKKTKEALNDIIWNSSQELLSKKKKKSRYKTVSLLCYHECNKRKGKNELTHSHILGYVQITSAKIH